MTEHEAWIPETPRRTWLSRVLAPEANSKPVTTAFAVAILAAAAFVASLTMSWQSANIPREAVDGSRQGREIITYTNNVTNPDMLGLVYALGTLALLGLLGAVINRADQAMRLRLVAAGLTVGMLGVVLAITRSLPDVLYNQFGPYGLPDNVNFSISYEPGLLCAYLAVLLPIVAIWLAGRPAVRAAQGGDHAGYGGSPVPARHALVHHDPALVHQASGDGAPPYQRVASWSAPRAEPIDLTVTPER